jgi:hypothetical protein
MFRLKMPQRQAKPRDVGEKVSDFLSNKRGLCERKLFQTFSQLDLCKMQSPSQSPRLLAVI